MEKLKEAKKFLEQEFNGPKPNLGIVLGSGLSDLAQSLEIIKSIPYSKIPHFPQSTVEGHKGNLILGEYKGIQIMLFQGRVHYYEGYDPLEVIFPLRLFKLLGGKDVMLTNASGSLVEDWAPGEIMVINDQINFTGYNPLVGKNFGDLGPRFPDMSEPYKTDLSIKIKNACEKASLKTHEGVYIGVSGPSYETPAEIKAFQKLGAHAVGMSTVPECIAANHMGLRVCGLACLTNFASGISPVALSHKEVQETSEKTKPKLLKAITNFLDQY